MSTTDSIPVSNFLEDAREVALDGLLATVGCINNCVFEAQFLEDLGHRGGLVNILGRSGETRDSRPLNSARLAYLAEVAVEMEADYANMLADLLRMGRECAEDDAEAERFRLKLAQTRRVILCVELRMAELSGSA